MEFYQVHGDAGLWEGYLLTYPEDVPQQEKAVVGLSAPCIRVLTDDTNLFLEVQYADGPHDTRSLATVSIKGDDITRSEQEWWLHTIKERMAEVQDSEYVHFCLK